MSHCHPTFLPTRQDWLSWPWFFLLFLPWNDSWCLAYLKSMPYRNSSDLDSDKMQMVFLICGYSPGFITQELFYPTVSANWGWSSDTLAKAVLPRLSKIQHYIKPLGHRIAPVNETINTKRYSSLLQCLWLHPTPGQAACPSNIYVTGFQRNRLQGM
jgi:hypothetical protein